MAPAGRLKLSLLLLFLLSFTLICAERHGLRSGTLHLSAEKRQKRSVVLDRQELQSSGASDAETTYGSRQKRSASVDDKVTDSSYNITTMKDETMNCSEGFSIIECYLNLIEANGTASVPPSSGTLIFSSFIILPLPKPLMVVADS
ncbi:Protein of unknown function [Gryllus bimaculatus]|nr:Protein of unknown function [Gryllus bimaculatus]